MRLLTIAKPQSAPSIQPIELYRLDELSNFAAKQFSHNFAHLYKPQYLAEHLQKTCSTDYFTRAIAAGTTILTAILQGQIVGYLKYGKVELPCNPHYKDKEIHRCYIHPKTQGQGVGKLLMHKALADIGTDANIFLGVWSENYRAQAFYQSFGFEKVGEYDYIVGSHVDKEYVYKKTAGKISHGQSSEV